jgi:hypothetical protein
MGRAAGAFREAEETGGVRLDRRFRLRRTRVPRAPSVSASPRHLPLQGRRRVGALLYPIRTAFLLPSMARDDV